MSSFKFQEPDSRQFFVIGATALVVALALAFWQTLWSAAPFALIAAYMFAKARSAAKSEGKQAS
jgi:hypothetical protein